VASTIEQVIAGLRQALDLLDRARTWQKTASAASADGLAQFTQVTTGSQSPQPPQATEQITKAQRALTKADQELAATQELVKRYLAQLIGDPATPATTPQTDGQSPIRHLTISQQRAVRSLRQQIVNHQTKLDAYRADPSAYDNLGILAGAPTPEIRERIIERRIRHLETEINGFQTQVDVIMREVEP